MQRFDCLALDCPLFGPHLLEASAGTGKTFSIEHIYVRLILESLEVEQILAVTFTRAATRELKSRIRANLEKALYLVKSQQLAWAYLQPYLGSEQAIRLLSDALAGFDRCQIFTIHGFCYRMLKEFAFEANVGALSNPDEGIKVPEKLQAAVLDFLKNGIDENFLCKEQICLLLKQFDSIEEIAEKLLRLEEVEICDSFSDLSAKCKAALHDWKGAPIEEEKLFEDFLKIEKNYKTSVKGNFENQVRALANPSLFPYLLKERGSVFEFLSSENRKVKAQEPPFLHYPGFFDWASQKIGPLVKQKVFPVLQMVWNRVAEKILAQEEYFDPDGILEQMQTALGQEAFAASVRKKYTAAIIDEFQDTDNVQWDIFQKLFFTESVKALYLVGDPKQSIYRFRKADVYTYLQARDFLGENHLYQLDTNFRSSKSLIGALNALFSRDWLQLPKIGRSLPYHPVRAGAEIESNFSDGKGALHFFLAEGEPNHLFDEVFLPYAVSEIERLELRRCALLVKDRFQSQKALEFLKKRGISAVAKSHTPLGQTPSFRAIEELFAAVIAPHDRNVAQIVMAGPFGRGDLSFSECRALLEEKGLVPFAKEFPLDSDGMQIFEQLFIWEKKEGFSFEGLLRFLKSLKCLDAASGGGRRMEVEDEAVQIMTMHISKGLEFDVVFALGLISRTPQAEEIEELDAEKKRQLYVAMTRAKKRLYVPVALTEKEPEIGTHSPIELFSRHFEGSFQDHLTEISKQESLTIENLALPITLGTPIAQKVVPSSPPSLSPRPFTPSYLSSFTTLAQGKENEEKWSEPPADLFTLQTMPRGPDTGIAIHSIFEKLFGAAIPLWRDVNGVRALVEEHLRFSPLLPWKEAIFEMVLQTVAMPLQTEEGFFSLSEIEKFQVEMEFIFSASPHFVKGVIDLIFYHQNKVYFLDWKSNWLEQYDRPSLQRAMEVHDYGLQADLYKEAIQRHFKKPFGGAFYVFVRGGAYLLTGVP